MTEEHESYTINSQTPLEDAINELRTRLVSINSQAVLAIIVVEGLLKDISTSLRELEQRAIDIKRTEKNL